MSTLIITLLLITNWVTICLFYGYRNGVLKAIDDIKRAKALEQEKK